MGVIARAPFAAALLALALASCSESDVVTIRIKLQEDGTGMVTTTSLHRPQDKSPLEPETAGVEWQERAALRCAKGTFKSLAEVAIAGIKLTSGTTADGLSYARATLPTGKAARWCGVMAPTPEDQKSLAATFDPTGKSGSAGSLLKLELEVPGHVTAVGCAPDVRGGSTDKYKERATLIVPIQRALEDVAGGAITFDVTWKKK